MTKKAAFFIAIFAIMAFAAACGTTTGSKNLNKDAVSSITEGKTTKDEVAKMLGHPANMQFFNKQQLEDYLYRLTLKRPPLGYFPEDNYEVWFYEREDWSMILPTPILSVDKSTKTKCLLIFNGQGTCIKKSFGQKSDHSLF